MHNNRNIQHKHQKLRRIPINFQDRVINLTRLENATIKILFFFVRRIHRIVRKSYTFIQIHR